MKKRKKKRGPPRKRKTWAGSARFTGRGGITLRVRGLRAAGVRMQGTAGLRALPVLSSVTSDREFADEFGDEFA